MRNGAEVWVNNAIETARDGGAAAPEGLKAMSAHEIMKVRSNQWRPSVATTHGMPHA
jgi:hypothetical protein